MRKWLPGIGLVLAIIGVIALFAVVIITDNNTRNTGREAFARDLMSLGYVLAADIDGEQNPRIEDETSGSKTATEYEALVIVRKCPLEMEQKLGEEQLSFVNGRNFRYFVLGEGRTEGGADFDIDNGPVTPTPQQAEAFITDPANKARFQHCLDPAVK